MRAASDGTSRALLHLRLNRDDEEGTRHLPEISFQPELGKYDKALMCCALVRAGVQHPGLLDEDLRSLHRDAFRDHHVELFTDLNALSTGLLRHLVDSLGEAVARVVVSSSSIDVLHEYQSKITKGDGRGGELLRRAEMTRALRLLDEMRTTTPVHIHQLRPGSSRYFQRGSAGLARRLGGATKIDEDNEPNPHDELTLISKDRQMIAAFWDYMSRSNPRLLIRLIMSDFSLAHVCAAERVPFLFARSPHSAYWHRVRDLQQALPPGDFRRAVERYAKVTFDRDKLGGFLRQWVACGRLRAIQRRELGINDNIDSIAHVLNAFESLVKYLLLFDSEREDVAFRCPGVLLFLYEFELIWHYRRDRLDQFLQSPGPCRRATSSIAFTALPSARP